MLWTFLFGTHDYNLSLNLSSIVDYCSFRGHICITLRLQCCGRTKPCNSCILNVLRDKSVADDTHWQLARHRRATQTLVDARAFIHSYATMTSFVRLNLHFSLSHCVCIYLFSRTLHCQNVGVLDNVQKKSCYLSSKVHTCSCYQNA